MTERERDRESDRERDGEGESKKIERVIERVSERVFTQYLCVIHEYSLAVFYLGGHYGLFAHMTKVRNEIRLEMRLGNPWRETDRQTGRETEEEKEKEREKDWEVIEFYYKPDCLSLSPQQVYPSYHMPRLDWMMWFMAFKPSVSSYPRWMWNFLLSLLENEERDREGEGGGERDSKREREREDVLMLLPDQTRKLIHRLHFLHSTRKEMKREEEEKERERVKLLKEREMDETKRQTQTTDRERMLQSQQSVNDRVSELLKTSEERLKDTEGERENGLSSFSYNHLYLRLRYFKYDFYRDDGEEREKERERDNENEKEKDSMDIEGKSDFIWNATDHQSADREMERSQEGQEKEEDKEGDEERERKTTNDKTNQKRERQYWTADYIGTLLSPVTYDELYELYDSQFSDKINAAKSRRGTTSRHGSGSVPKAETAQEIILRTLFRNAARKKAATAANTNKL
jgi:hypothetical protein